jgi:hypothetical protein
MVLATKNTDIDCPYNEKDDVKALGARWDPERRKWYVEAGAELDDFARWLSTRVYLNCQFKDKDEVKALGARWDPERRKWCIGGSQDKAPFARWLPAAAGGAPVGGAPADGAPAAAVPSTPERRQAPPVEPVTGKKRAPEPARADQTFTCPVHGVAMNGPLSVRKGQPHNIGKQFYKCSHADNEACGLRGGFKWADGSAPFSAESCRRAESHHGMPADSIGVGVAGVWVADELRHGVPINPKRHRLDDELAAAAEEDGEETEEDDETAAPPPQPALIVD